MNLLLLGVLWIVWCTMHSLLIARPVTGYLQRLLGGGFKYYRLFYNLTAILTLMPLLLLTWQLRGGMVFAWQGYWQILRFLLLATAGWLFWAGTRRYDMGYFLGIRQIRSGAAHILLSETEEFSTAGVFGLTRHPWYLGSILLIWSILPEYSIADLMVSTLLSIYIVIGTFLEERKLLAEYGDAYRRYQRQVRMFL
jgi:protein-S-isoprenylcysteine O-methyltransferase Ste14